RKDGRLVPGKLALLQGVGGGFTWGSVLVRMETSDKMRSRYTANAVNNYSLRKTTMKFALVFPGQGSHTVGMLDAWRDNAAVQAVMAEADQALGQPLSALIAEGPAEDLNLTTNTQPAMLSASLAMYKAWVE